MTARQEIEDMLDAQAWAKRNGLDEPVYLPPAELLAQHEATNYRSEPASDAYDELPLIPRRWGLGIGLLFCAAFWATVYLLTRH